MKIPLTSARPTEKRLSWAMRRMLTNIREGRGTHYDIHGRSAHGGAVRTIYALTRRGYIDRDCNITPAGIARLEIEVPSE